MKNIMWKVILTLALVFATLTATQALAMLPFSGGGTESDPFIIADETDLRALSAYVNDGEDHEGEFFKLADDIELADPWTPIGTLTNVFRGAFDGNGKIISGLSINADDGYQGLFGCVGSSGKVERLGVVGSINVTGDSDNIGGVVGRNFGTVSQCGSAVDIVVNANEYYGDYVGGVVGDNRGTVENCLNIRAVSSSGSNIGGIVGDNEGGNVSFSYNVAPVYGNDYVGGIVGYNHSEGTVTSCVSLGAIVAANYGSGADVGRVTGGSTSTLANNKAHVDMVIEKENGSPVQPSEIGEDKIDGADVALDTPQPVVFAGWSSEVWNIPNETLAAVFTSDGELPILKCLNRPYDPGYGELSDFPDGGEIVFDGGGTDYEGDGYTLTLPDGWEKGDELSSENSVSFKGGMLQSIRIMKHPKAELTDGAKAIYIAGHENNHGFEHKDATVDGNDALGMFYWLNEDEELRYAGYWIAAPDALYSVSFSIYTPLSEIAPDELISGFIDSMKFGDGNRAADSSAAAGNGGLNTPAPTPQPSPASGMSDEEFLRLCQTGTAREVEAAVKDGANVNAADEYGTTALMLAASSNRNAEVISILLENGADASKVDDEGMNAADYAAVNARIRNTDAYRQLAAATASRAMSDEEFLELCVAGTEQEVEAAVKDGANVNARDEYGETALMVASRSNRNPGVVSVLLRNGADASITDNEEMSAADYASVNPRLRNSDVYRELLAAIDAAPGAPDTAVPELPSGPDSTEGALPAVPDADGTLVLKLSDASSLATAALVVSRTADELSKIFGFQEMMEALTPNIDALNEFLSAARELSLLINLSDDPALYLSLFVDEDIFDGFISKPHDFENSLFRVGDWFDASLGTGWTIKPADELESDHALYVMKLPGEPDATVLISNAPGGIEEMLSAVRFDSPSFEAARVTAGDSYYHVKLKEGITVADMLKGLPPESGYIDLLEALAVDKERILRTTAESSWTFNGDTLDFDSYSDIFALNPEYSERRLESRDIPDIYGEGGLAFFLSADVNFILRSLLFGADVPAELLPALIGDEMSSFLSESDVRNIKDSVLSVVCVEDGSLLSTAYLMLETESPETADKLFALSYFMEGTSVEIPGWRNATVWSLPIPEIPDIVLAKNEGTLLLGLGTDESLGRKLAVPDENKPYLSQDNVSGTIVSSRLIDVALNIAETAVIMSGRNMSGEERQIYDAAAALRDSFDVIYGRVLRSGNSGGKIVFKEGGDMLEAYLNLLSAVALPQAAGDNEDDHVNE